MAEMDETAEGKPEEQAQPVIIAGTYEILQKIGAGGAGIVYLGRHVRLGKDVVLKADKRKLTTKPEVLRREVDALKNLSHSYIPQVYDFVQENDTVYTVMDYIQGESLDKPLERGERFSQAQIVEWSCELLEALVYLHTRPPHGILHSDIKPANIMITPENEIRLIDFNIALALGEEGSVRVGFSRGYASPEHYGLDFTFHGSLTSDTERTVLTEEGATLSESVRKSQSATGGTGTGGSSTGSGKRTVLLDVRSDIYSAGATLYHLMTGRKPPQDARQVPPIDAAGISPAVAEIIAKAMQPNPDLRYQTAQEMLWAFEHLHENDPRTRRRRRNLAITAAGLALCFLLGGGGVFAGLRQRAAAEEAARYEAERAEQAEREAKEREQTAKRALELVTGGEDDLRAGNMVSAKEKAVSAISLESPYRSQAQNVLTEALGVYDLSPGYHAKLAIDLPSEPLKAELSPEGTRACAIYAWFLGIFDTATGARLAELPVEESALSDAVFLDENRIAYAGPGGLRVYDLSAGAEVWSGAAATRIVRSADGKRLAAVCKDAPEAVVYDAATGEVIKAVSFEGRGMRVPPNDVYAAPRNDVLALNATGDRLAVTLSGGTLMIYDLAHEDNDLELPDLEYSYFDGGFHGPYFALAGRGGGASDFILLNAEEMALVGTMTDTQPFYLQADESGIYLANRTTLVRFDPETYEQRELAYTEKDVQGFVRSGGGYSMLSQQDKSVVMFSPQAEQLSKTETGYVCDFLRLSGPVGLIAGRDAPRLRILALADHADAEILAYGAADRHDEARLSADGKTAMLFDIYGFRVYAMDGTLLAEVALPDPELIYDQQFRREGDVSWLEVIYRDGLRRGYSAADGALLEERQGEKPDMSLYEEFFTDRYRFASPLHEAAAVYDRETGEKLRELEKDAALTYVTQIGDLTLTEYMSNSEDLRFGLLLDENLETIARLPRLCDYAGGRFIFDYPTVGSLRATELYTLDRLLELAAE